MNDWTQAGRMLARTSLSGYIDFYNKARPHSSLKAQTTDQVYFNSLPESMAA